MNNSDIIGPVLFVCATTLVINILFWFFPDRFFAMKTLHLKLEEDNFEELLVEFKMAHAKILPLRNLIILNVLAEIILVALGIIFGFEKEIFGMNIGFSFISVFLYNIYSMYRAFSVLELK